MAKSSELARVRKVLDYVPSSEMSSWAGRGYFEALNRRLNREVALEATVIRTTQPARDEAVLVVTPEEWEAAQAARRTQAENQAELEQVKQELELVHARSAELQREVDELRSRLSGLKVEEEKRRNALKLIGVRRPSLETAVATTTSGAEAVSEEPRRVEEEATLPTQDELEDAGWVIVPEPLPESEDAAKAAEEAAARKAEDAIRRVEDEILKIETELANLAQREQVLRRRAQEPGGPYTFQGYTLYQRMVGSGERARPLYFFSREEPVNGEPLRTVPDGYVVGMNPRTGMPYLKRAGRSGASSKGAGRSKKRRSRRGA